MLQPSVCCDSGEVSLTGGNHMDQAKTVCLESLVEGLDFGLKLSAI